MSDTATTDTDVLFRDDVDDIEEMPTRASRRIVTAWTIVFAALVVAGAGFVAGIQIEKRNAPAAAASGLPPGLRSFANGGGSAGGQLPAATTQGDAGNAGTTGKVKLVDGANVYITTSDGSTVKVSTSSSSKVTKSVDAALNDLKAGDTIVVQGTTDADGTIAASSISQTS
jgi:hypothetical protein